MKCITKNIGDKTICHLLQTCLGDVEPLARETRFVQRSSPLSGTLFLHMLLTGFLQNPQADLIDLAVRCAELKVRLSPQAIHARINAFAVRFLEKVYRRALAQLQNRVKVPLALLRQFSAIWIVDSTFKQLPESMVQDFPGAGGKSSKASLKIQLVYEFLCGNLAQVTLQPGRCADQAYRDYLPLVQAGSLVLMDLGYFCLASLQAIAQAGAYFIVRYPSSTNLYTPAGQKIDLLALLQAQAAQADLEQRVWIGAHRKIPLEGRVIAHPVPLAVAEERRRKARRAAATHGKTPSARHLALLAWSIYLTNVPASWLSTAQVMTVYRIRWQIELIFKFWKSECGFEDIPATRKERVLTELYAKLLIALCVLFLVAPVRVPDASDRQLELSMFQVRKFLVSTGPQLLQHLNQTGRAIRVLREFYDLVSRFGFKQRRITSPNVMGLFDDPVLPELSLA